VNQQHFFKTAFGTEALEPNNRYYFEIRCLKGSNFKIGIAEAGARSQTNQAFSDTKLGYSYFSAGQLRHNSKGQGPIYGEAYKEEDVIGCYVDLIDGIIFFSKNGQTFEDAFTGPELLGKTFYPAACCLTRGESFELCIPLIED